MGEAIDVAAAVCVIEDVKEAGVDNGIEALVPLVECERVFLEKLGSEAALGGFLVFIISTNASKR